jgi:four helix bundle protein
MGKSILKDKSFVFAIAIVRLTQCLQNDKKEFIMSKQVLRSGTSIGALIREAEFGQSKPDFRNKMNIALKEANESDYWLHLLHETGYLENQLFNSLRSDCNELISMLVATIKTSKQSTQN